MPSTPGQIIRSRRNELGLSREELAYECATSVSTIARLELSDRIPTIKIASAIADRLGLSLDVLRTTAASA